MPSPADFKDSLKQQADIVQVIGQYARLKKAGAQNYLALCPFHNEKTPSFSVHATRQFFHCFGCGASGDVFSFLQKIEQITFGEAVRELAGKLGVPMPRLSFDSPAEERDAKLRASLLEIQERACSWFQQQLRRPEAAYAREYLTGRGVSEQMIARFRIGFAPESGYLLRDHLRADCDEELLKQSGLFSWKEDNSQAAAVIPQPDDGAEVSDVAVTDSTSPREPSNKKLRSPLYCKFRNRIIFPICNESGRVIAFTGRTLASDERSGPKYLNSPETPVYQKSRVLFNLHQAKEAIRNLDYAILVEGQMDCISVFSAGFHNVIATSGTAFTEAQARLLGRFSRRVVINFDPDAAGAAAAERSLALLVEEDFEIKVLTLEQGFDPDLFLRRKGRPAYEGALKSAPRYFAYLIESVRSKFPVRTPEGKVKAINALLPHIQRVPSRIARDELANEISHRLGVDSAVLRQELKQAARSRSQVTVNAGASAQITDAERILIRCLAASGNLLADTRVSLRDGAEEDFDPARQVRFALQSEPLVAGLAGESLICSLATGESADPTSLPLSDPDRQLLAECLMREDEELTPELVEGAVRALRRRCLENRQRQIRTQIADAERRQDTAVLASLLREKVEIDRALSSGAALQ